MSDPAEHPGGDGQPRGRDRKATEQKLLAAAREMLARDGVLAGLNLREVADQAGVNRGLVYQYFGSRRELLRAAIADDSWQEAPVFHEGRAAPFVERRQQVLAETIRAEAVLKVTTLLVLDGDEDVRLFPQLDRSRADLERDQLQGDIAVEISPIAAHVLTAAMNFGYAIFREQFSKEVGLSTTELDGQVQEVAARMLQGLAAPASK